MFFSCVALPPFSVDVSPLRIFFRYCTTRKAVLHRGGCKYFAVHGFGGWSAGLEAALTSKEAAGKELKVQRARRQWRPRQICWVETAAAAAVIIAARAIPPQTNGQARRRWQSRQMCWVDTAAACLLLFWRRERFPHKRIDRPRMTK